MPAMETLPMPLEAMRGADPGLAEFRVGSPGEIFGLLKQLADGNVALSLSTPDGASYATTVWALDPGRGLLCLSADARDHQLQALLESDEVVAVAYLDSVKLQFDLHDLVLVHGHAGCALNARFPREVYRFQRRNSYRVRPLLNTRPTATLRHPALPDMQLELRVIDVSIGGIALFLPDDVPAIEPGVKIEQVLIELDGDTRVQIGLMIHHITLLHHESKGVRLGCEMLKLGGDGERTLQRYIDQTQKRRRLLVL
jgi:c-di-GMP-binding flagellar brake protein YcgR